MRYNSAEHTGSLDINGTLILPITTTGSIANPESGSLMVDTDNNNRLLVWLGDWREISTTII